MTAPRYPFPAATPSHDSGRISDPPGNCYTPANRRIFDLTLDRSDGRTYSAAVRAARVICGTCPIRETCLRDNATLPGVVAGLTPQERSKLLAGRAHPCGTPAAYNRHRRRGEKPCFQCARAHATYLNEKRAKARKAS